MDEATRPGGQEIGAPDGEDQQRSPQELRRDIEATRIELGDTVEALAEKADVKAQAKQRMSTVKDTAQHKKDEFVSKAKQATPDSASTGAQQVLATAQRKPVPFAAAGAFAAGALAGWVLGHRQMRS